MDNGRLTDVLIEELRGPDRMGLDKFYNLEVWADAGCKEIIIGVEGVVDVYTDSNTVKYNVYLDPRYDREWIKAEIEAAIKCRD